MEKVQYLAMKATYDGTTWMGVFESKEEAVECLDDYQERNPDEPEVVLFVQKAWSVRHHNF